MYCNYFVVNKSVQQGVGRVLSSPLPGLEPVGGEPLISVSRGQFHVRLNGYLLSRKTLWQRHTTSCVSNSPRVALDSEAACIRTHVLSPRHRAIRPSHFLALVDLVLEDVCNVLLHLGCPYRSSLVHVGPVQTLIVSVNGYLMTQYTSAAVGVGGLFHSVSTRRRAIGGSVASLLGKGGVR